MRQLLEDARQEIDQLRRRNEVLQAKVDTMHLFEMVLHTKPAIHTVGMAEDVAWKLQREIDRLDEEERQAPDPA
jgi:hypothetical protein